MGMRKLRLWPLQRWAECSNICAWPGEEEHAKVEPELGRPPAAAAAGEGAPLFGFGGRGPPTFPHE